MSDTTQRWIRGFRDGQDDVIAEFWQAYEPRLRRLAERNLAGRMRRRLDPDDLVQSAFRTFLRRAGKHEFELKDRDMLMSLLCTILLNKVRRQVRDLHAIGQGGDKGSSVGLSNHPRVQDRQGPAIVAAANQAACALPKSQHCPRQLVIHEGVPPGLRNTLEARLHQRSIGDVKGQPRDHHAAQILAAHVDALPETGGDTVSPDLLPSFSSSLIKNFSSSGRPATRFTTGSRPRCKPFSKV